MVESLALLEIDGLARAVRAQDAALKKAPVEMLACAPVSPGKMLLVFAGNIAAVQESLAAIEPIIGSRLIDRLFLPGVRPEVVAALRGELRQRQSEALAIFELRSVAAAVEAADAAVKSAPVQIGRLHPAAGFGGKGYFTLFGILSDLEAAAEAAAAAAGERLLDAEIIAAPHDEIEATLLKRFWPLDPA